MSPSTESQRLTRRALHDLRSGRTSGLSRRQLMRRSIGAAATLWLLEVGAGTLGFLWPNLARGFGGEINVGDFEDVAGSPEIPGLTLTDGAPAYLPNARTFVQLENPDLGFADGVSPDGEGATTNVRTMWQRCPHLGCKPNFCAQNYWFECPCHGSRFDRLGTKIQGLGPAPRSLDRFPHVVRDGSLVIDTGRVVLGPLPLALGQPGLIPPRSATGCL